MSNACKDIESIREDINILRDAIDPNMRRIYYELIDIIIKINKATYAQLGKDMGEHTISIHDVLDEMKIYRNNVLSHIAPHVINGNLGDMDVSSLVNMNGEISDCIKDISKAITNQDSHKRKH